MPTLKQIMKAFACLALLSLAFGCSGNEKKEMASKEKSTEQYVDDATITTKVKAAILQDSMLNSMQISVDTNQGVVTLSGTVNNQDMVTEAGKVTAAVTGVKKVENNLTVKPAQ
ncbi:transport-associated protein [Desulfovibrio sp. X2]|uniref:BON domain-containing protein n=1 Tax=Desulfovibrio sp. X2 TaxID=941449 RepID=UPI000358D7AA|nr:BON domain-containing protein [Desulfovibrio sp. X2]EPR44685.1 transport-associated protein [Desulfovibrio sp. X2]